MWWKFLVEIVLGILMLMCSFSFWSIIKLPAHLSSVLADPSELKRILGIIGSDRLKKEAESIEPVYGSYLKNMMIDKLSLFGALRMTKNLTLLGAAILIALSYFLGIIFVIINFLLFLLPSLLGPQPIAKQHNYNHLYTVILNVYKWNKVDPNGCLAYCNKEDLSLKQVYLTISELNQT